MKNYRKIIETVVFFANNASRGTVSKLHLLKMIFLADRYHMRMFARSITGDDYYAMTYGPVASACKDVAEGSVPEKFRDDLASALSISGYCISARRPARMDVFSQTDVEALKAACGVEAQTRDLVAFSHEFPEWTKHRDVIEGRGYHARETMDPLDMFLVAPAGVEYCPADAERLEAAKSIFIENCAAEAELNG